MIKYISAETDDWVNIVNDVKKALNSVYFPLKIQCNVVIEDGDNYICVDYFPPFYFNNKWNETHIFDLKFLTTNHDIRLTVKANMVDYLQLTIPKIG